MKNKEVGKNAVHVKRGHCVGSFMDTVSSSSLIASSAAISAMVFSCFIFETVRHLKVVVLCFSLFESYTPNSTLRI